MVGAGFSLTEGEDTDQHEETARRVGLVRIRVEDIGVKLSLAYYRCIWMCVCVYMAVCTFLDH